jgi:hypothetical protein
LFHRQLFADSYSPQVIAFLQTRPINIITPRIVNIFKVLFVKAKANKAPIKESGMANKTTNGAQNYRIILPSQDKPRL